MLGQGYQDALGTMEADLVTPFINMAYVDDVLAQTRHLNPGDMQSDYFRDLLHDAHHRIMVCLIAVGEVDISRTDIMQSLPPFEAIIDSTAITDGGRLAAAYELARLAATIYSCAVILPLPTVTGWHLKLCARLHTRMQLSNTTSWPVDLTPLLIWVLMVANMAGLHYDQRDCFLYVLRKLLDQAGLKSWSDLHKVLGSFAWSDAACATGAVAVWDTLNVIEVHDDSPLQP